MYVALFVFRTKSTYSVDGDFVLELLIDALLLLKILEIIDSDEAVLKWHAMK